MTASSPAEPRLRGTRVVLVLLGLVAVLLIGARIVAAQVDDTTPGTATRRVAGLTGVDVGGTPIAITVDGRGAFVANERDEVVRLDPRTGRIATRVPMDFNVVGVFTDPDLGIWAMGGAGPAPGGHLAFLAPSTLRPPFTVDLPEPPTALAFAAGSVWVTSASKLYRVDSETGRVSPPFVVDAGAAGLHALTAAGGLLWSADRDRLLAFDPARGTTTAVVATPAAWVTSMAKDGRWLWTSSSPAGHPSVLERRDATTGVILASYPDFPLAYYNGGESAVIAADESVWAVTRAGVSLIRTTPDGEIARVMAIPRQLRSTSHRQYRYFGVGAGALWYSTYRTGRVYRIPLP